MRTQPCVGAFSYITFDSTLTGVTIPVLTNQLLVLNKFLFIDAGDLAVGPDLYGDQTTRLFGVDFDAALTLRNLNLLEGFAAMVPDKSGGGIYSFGAVTLDHCTITRCRGRNSLGAGGAIMHRGDVLLLSHTDLVDNTGEVGPGGAIGCYLSGPVCLLRTTIADNVAGEAGGIDGRADSHLQIYDSHLTRNTAILGGAMYRRNRNFTAVNTTFSDNTAELTGGALQLFSYRPSLLVQCTFSQNSAGTAGGAIYVESNTLLAPIEDTAVLRYCTLTSNSAPEGAAIFMDNLFASPKVTLYSTIASGNLPTDLNHDVGASFTSEGYNLVGLGDVAAFVSPGDQTLVADPLLAPLGDYGGFTPTHAPRPGSPAVDAGPLVPPAGISFHAKDQRFYPRQIDSDGDGSAELDIGSYESGSAAGGFGVWAVERIPEGSDDSFVGHADADMNPNGFEYAIHTNPALTDGGSPRNLRLVMGQGLDVRFGFRPDAPDLTWVVYRTLDFSAWDEVYRFDGTSATSDQDVFGYADAFSGQIFVSDFSAAPRAAYHLEVEYHP